MVARLALTQGVKVRFLYAPLLQLGKNTYIFPTSQMEQAATWKKRRFFHTNKPAGALNTERGQPSKARKKGDVEMAGIFTRKAIAAILNDENMTPEERTDQLFSLYGRALDDGYITKTAAQAAQNAAVETARESWTKEQPKINVLETEEYKALRGEYDGYKAKQSARNSDEYKDVKPKFFDRVYDLVDRADGAKPVADQLADLRANYEEYFVAPPAANPAPIKPQFGAKPEGSMPTGAEGAVAAFANAWGFAPKKN